MCLEPSELPGPLTLKCKHALGVGGGSTVTLVQADRKLLVDTAFDYEHVTGSRNQQHNAENLLFSLRLQGLSPQEIDAVFITHWHRDHFGNLDLFPKAQWLVSIPLHQRLKRKGLHGVKDGEEIAGGVKVLYTPGHTSDHVSVLVTCHLAGLKARIVIAGDAVISYSYFVLGKVWKNNADFYDPKVALESMHSCYVRHYYPWSRFLVWCFSATMAGKFP